MADVQLWSRPPAARGPACAGWINVRSVRVNGGRAVAAGRWTALGRTGPGERNQDSHASPGRPGQACRALASAGPKAGVGAARLPSAHRTSLARRSRRRVCELKEYGLCAGGGRGSELAVADEARCHGDRPARQQPCQLPHTHVAAVTGAHRAGSCRATAGDGGRAGSASATGTASTQWNRAGVGQQGVRALTKREVSMGMIPNRRCTCSLASRCLCPTGQAAAHHAMM
jgi:hypothetical protein